jgi:hypothetical protein
VFKKGTRTDALNYRPISLTSICCKVLEKIVREAILQHMTRNDFLSDSQHGFVSGRSCTTQLLRVVDKWSEVLDRGGALDAIYLDFAKAFDSVPHKRLLGKLSSYGIDGKTLQWIQHFLTERRQRVVVAGTFSSWTEVLSGVPQGSVLGPLLFVCYINDLPDEVRSLIYLYADDSKIFREVNTVYDKEALQKDLDYLTGWELTWQLRFNVEKCKVMHLGGDKNNQFNYSLNHVRLDKTTLEKDLGVWMSNDLASSLHVLKAVSKANQILGLIRRSFTYLDCKLMKQLFIALVRPHLEYGNVVWHPYLKKDLSLLEGVQHRATKMVPGLAELPYEERLRCMSLPSLVYRRLRGDAIEAYKYLRGIYNVDSQDILPRHVSSGVVRTRGHCLKIQKRSCKGRLRANYFGLRVVNLWNSLPEDVVTANTTNCFKNRFDRLFKRRCYSETTEDTFWLNHESQLE